MEAIMMRRSIRKYSDRPVEAEKIDKLLRAAMQAPSAGNQQPWEFIVVQDKETLAALSGVSPYAKLIASAPLAVIMLANDQRLQAGAYWEQDMSAATENLLLEAVNQNLGGVWLGVAPLEERMSFVSEVFGLEKGLMPFAIVALGYPAESQKNSFTDRYDPSRIHYETYKPKAGL